MNRADQERVWRMAITEIQQGQHYATCLEGVNPFALESALAKIDSALLDLEGMRDVWRAKVEEPAT